MRPHYNKFGDKIVLITGASHGIGKQTALEFASAGAKVVILVARTESKLVELGSIIRGGTQAGKVIVSFLSL